MTDWNPLDPDFENVYYDLSSWTSDQQAELTARLANADIPHAWVESELVVSAEVRAQLVGVSLATIDRLLKPFRPNEMFSNNVPEKIIGS